MAITANSNILLKIHLDFFQKMLFKSKFTSMNSGDSLFQKFKFNLPSDSNSEKVFEILTTDKEDGSSSVRFLLTKTNKQTCEKEETTTKKLFLNDAIAFLRTLNHSLFQRDDIKNDNDEFIKSPANYEFLYFFFKKNIEDFNLQIDEDELNSFNSMKENLSLPISEMVYNDEFFNVLRWAKLIVNGLDSKWSELVTDDEIKRLKLIASLD